METHPGTDRPRHRATRRRPLPARRRHRRTRRARQPPRTARRSTGRPRPAARRVVADAAVLGASFPAEAVSAVSDLDADTTRTVLAELLRREVLEISADPLSPERGNYRFTQELLRQVAYDTLSRRDRKSRHLAVAAHLRATFPATARKSSTPSPVTTSMPSTPCPTTTTRRTRRARHRRPQPRRRTCPAHRITRPSR